MLSKVTCNFLLFSFVKTLWIVEHLQHNLKVQISVEVHISTGIQHEDFCYFISILIEENEKGISK